MGDLEIGMPLVLKERSERGGNVIFIKRITTNGVALFHLLTDYGNLVIRTQEEMNDYIIPLWYQQHLETCEEYKLVNLLRGKQYLKDSIKGRMNSLQEVLTDLEAIKE